MFKNWKRTLAALLTLALLVGVMPGVFAAEPDATIAANATKDLRYLALDDENNGPNDLYYQQKIMNPVVEDAFVLWYEGKNTKYAISWTSSNPDLLRINDVTHMAELTAIPDADTAVTLTATMAVPYTSGSVETYPMEKQLVVQVPCKATRLQMDADALVITNEDDVRGNLPLLKHGKYGADISWTSSDPAVITDESADSDLYDGGVVTRPAYGSKPAAVTLTATLSYDGKTLTKTFPVTVSPMPAPVAAENYDHYLFACYAERYDWNQDSITTEEIYFGLSDNGLQWQNINVYTAADGKEYTRPILRSTVGDMGTRDPHIIRSHDGDKFFVLATDLHAVGTALPEREGAEFKGSFDCVNGNRDLVIWETNDLTDWGEPRLVKCNFASSGDTYAPEAIWDADKQAYLVYWASKDNAELNADGTYKPSKVGKIYYCYTRDFNTFSEPTLWLSSTDDAMKNAFPTVTGEYDIYDTTISYDPYDGLYYRFGTKNKLYVQTSKSLSGPWSDAVALPGAINSGWGVEAPTAYQLTDGSWMLLGDNYRQYVPYKAAHLADFISGNYESMSFEYAANGPRYKHGTILPITEAEYIAMMVAYDDSIAPQETPATGEGYTIDYAAETMTVASGYAVSAAKAVGATISGDISDYIGQTLYIRKPLTADAKASAWAEFPIPARPAAPATALSVSTTADSITVDNAAAFVGCEFSIGDGWNNTGVFTGLETGKEYTVAVRTKATDAAFVSASATLAVTPKVVNPFADVVEKAYYYDAVLWANAAGVTSGVTATRFAPEANCSRAQMVTFLWRAAGSPAPTLTDCPFTDVVAGSYYEKAVLWAVEKEITKGVTATTFGTDDTVTRAQAVTFLWRAAGTPEATANTAFTDVSATAYYVQAVAWAAKQDITKGTTATTFSPNSPCVRGQIVTFLYRSK